jgi:hypothetical protein
MGTGASVSREEVSTLPQYIILGGDRKFDELKDGDGKVELSKVADPYLKYGGAYSGDIKDTKDFKYVNYSSLPKFGAEHKSLMAKTLNQGLFDKLKDVKSSKGYTLSNAIMTDKNKLSRCCTPCLTSIYILLGVVTPHLGVGATAGDEECWELFRDLYYPIIKGWHGYDAYTQKHPVDLNPEHLKFTDEQRALFNEYVESTRIRAARNISGTRLTPFAPLPHLPCTPVCILL